MKRKRRKFSLIFQVTILFIVAVVITAFVTNWGLFQSAVGDVSAETERSAEKAVKDVKQSVRDYPAYKWLLSYWYSHSDDLDIEYDTDFYNGTKTMEKIRELAAHQPSFMIRYADEEQVRALPEEDQKLYAEIVYSWLITRINEIKSINEVSFLFCVITNDNFDSQFFLFSAGDGVTVRGTEYEQIYPLGVTVTVDESLQSAMKSAVRNSSYLAEAGRYYDYYGYFELIDGEPALIGLTFDAEFLIKNILSETISGVIFSAAILLVLGAICLILIIFVVIKPVKRIQRGIREYKETKNSEQVALDLRPIKQRNEIAQLSDDVVDLAREIDEYLDRIETITEERGKIKTELELASGIQFAMMPREFPPFPDRSEIDIFASIKPAKEVGGDFYDFFFTDDDHLALVIADVSGKGVPSALLMMSSKILIQSYAMLGLSVAEILEKTNETLFSKNEMEMFVTVWMGILDVSSGILKAANAGHEYPLYKKKDGAFEVIKDRHGIAIGCMDGLVYPEYEILMEPGDEIFVFTDGLVEAEDPDKKMFGTERAVDALNEEADAGPEEIIENVKKAVGAFVNEAEQFDDLTMLCMRYNGPAES